MNALNEEQVEEQDQQAPALLDDFEVIDGITDEEIRGMIRRADLRLKNYLQGASAGKRSLAAAQKRLVRRWKKANAKANVRYRKALRAGETTENSPKQFDLNTNEMGLLQREMIETSRRARAIHLLRAYLRGRPYKTVEEKINRGTLAPWLVVAAYTPPEIYFDSCLSAYNYEAARLAASEDLQPADVFDFLLPEFKAWCEGYPEAEAAAAVPEDIITAAAVS